MEIQISADGVDRYKGDAVIVGVMAEAPLSGAAAVVDAALEGLISSLIESQEIRGKLAEITILHPQGRLPASRVAVVGLGEPNKFGLIELRRAMGAASRILRDKGCRQVGSTLHDLPAGRAHPSQSIRATVEAAYLGLYRGNELKSDQLPPDEFQELTLLGIGENDSDSAVKEASHGRTVGEATNYARRLVNLPANQVTPSRLVKEAMELAARGGLEVEVLEPPRMKELGMGAFLAVTQGSEEPARMIMLHYQGKNRGSVIAFIGKGVTFDSGGISIKPSDKMHLMKSDMAGAAAVLGAIGAIAELKLNIDIIALIPATENLLSGRAYKPGDVVTAMNGKTIEVISTDAEGRMLLADALVYARQLGATHLVDIATLTGACVIALGHIASGVMGNDNALVEAVLAAGEQAGERMWRLPLFPEYRKDLDSKIADLKNVAGREAGAITAAWFLQEFCDNTSWVHIDIAGTSWSEKDEPYQIEGATGAGTRTLIALAERMAGGLK